MHSSARWGQWIDGSPGDDWAPSNVVWVNDDGGWDDDDWGYW